MIPAPIGHAYNQLGLPGDGSPPSRFIRAFFLRQYALLNAAPAVRLDLERWSMDVQLIYCCIAQDLNSTLILGQELLNAVYKPLGTIPVPFHSPALPAARDLRALVVGVTEVSLRELP